MAKGDPDVPLDLQAANNAGVRGVIAHELAHIRNRDILTSSVVATIASAISTIGWLAMWMPGSRDERGSMIVSVGVMMVLTLLSAAVVTRTVAGMRSTRQGQDFSAALAAAMPPKSKLAIATTCSSVISGWSTTTTTENNQL